MHARLLWIVLLFLLQLPVTLEKNALHLCHVLCWCYFKLIKIVQVLFLSKKAKVFLADPDHSPHSK